MVVYCTAGLLVVFSVNPSNHVWLLWCTKEFEETNRCPKKYSLVTLIATSCNEIEGSETGLERLGLTDNMDDLSVDMDTSKPSKSCICVMFWTTDQYDS